MFCCNILLQRFWKLRLSERLVVYLAVIDLAYSTNHLADHTFIIITNTYPPDELCQLFGFLVCVFARSVLIISCF